MLITKTITKNDDDDERDRVDAKGNIIGHISRLDAKSLLSGSCLNGQRERVIESGCFRPDDGTYKQQQRHVKLKPIQDELKLIANNVVCVPDADERDVDRYNLIV